MRKQWTIAIMVLTISITAAAVCAQHHPGEFGIGLSISGSTPGFILSISSSSSPLTIEPTFSMQITDNQGRNERYFSPGIGMLYQFQQEDDFRLHAGVRCGLDISRRAFSVIVYDEVFHMYPSEIIVNEIYTDIILGPVFGGRYYFSDNFALSGEFQVKAVFFDKQTRSWEDYRDAGELSISTSQVLAVYLYF